MKRREQALAETLRLKQQAEQSASEKNRLLDDLSQNQQALRDSSEHMSAIVNNAPDAVLIIDDEGRIMSCNRAAAAIFACSAGEMAGSPIGQWLPGHEVLAAGPTVAATESLARRSHGAPFPCDVSQARFQLSGWCLNLPRKRCFRCCKARWWPTSRMPWLPNRMPLN